MNRVKRTSSLIALVLGGAMLGSALTGTALAYQSHMWNALNAEQTAIHQLQIARPDKAGHRVNAINLLGQAITQTHLGITAGAQ